jgi:DTW domain-containing protein YfiP
MHQSETSLLSNTSYLASLTLENSEIYIRGKKDHPFNASDVVKEGYESLYLFPTEEAVILDQDYISKLTRPVNLVVPDGRWRQAAKFVNREEVFKNMRQVKLANVGDSIYQLRKSPSVDSLCTYEAIAYALKEVEGQEIFEALMTNLRYMVRAHLKARLLDPKILKEVLETKVGISEG